MRGKISHSHAMFCDVKAQAFTIFAHFVGQQQRGEPMNGKLLGIVNGKITYFLHIFTQKDPLVSTVIDGIATHSHSCTHKRNAPIEPLWHGKPFGATHIMRCVYFLAIPVKVIRIYFNFSVKDATIFSLGFLLPHLSNFSFSLRALCV